MEKIIDLNEQAYKKLTVFKYAENNFKDRNRFVDKTLANNI